MLSFMVLWTVNAACCHSWYCGLSTLHAVIHGTVDCQRCMLSFMVLWIATTACCHSWYCGLSPLHAVIHGTVNCQHCMLSFMVLWTVNAAFCHSWYCGLSLSHAVIHGTVCQTNTGANLSEPHISVVNDWFVYIYHTFSPRGQFMLGTNGQNGRPLRSHCVQPKYLSLTASNEKEIVRVRNKADTPTSPPGKNTGIRRRNSVN